MDGQRVCTTWHSAWRFGYAYQGEVPRYGRATAEAPEGNIARACVEGGRKDGNGGGRGAAGRQAGRGGGAGEETAFVKSTEEGRKGEAANNTKQSEHHSRYYLYEPSSSCSLPHFLGPDHPPTPHLHLSCSPSRLISLCPIHSQSQSQSRSPRQHLPANGGRVRAGGWGGSCRPVLDRRHRLAAPGRRDL